MFVKIGLPHVPRWSAVIAFSGIVESLAMTAHEKHFVHGVGALIGVEGFYHFGELLPLGCVG
jgi:hypothetical protein